MSFLKTIIPLFIVLGLLQAGVLALPLIYWRFQFYLNPIERYLFGALLCFTAFVLHPLIIITLITFTIAPTLLSMRHNITSRLSTVYMALLPTSLQSSLADPASNLFGKGFLGNGMPRTNRDWLMTALGGYVGWKTLGLLPFVMVAGVFLALRGGKEDGRRSGPIRGRWVEDQDGEAQGRERAAKGEAGVSVRRRTDVQVVG